MPQDLSASLAIAIVDLLAERAEALERVVVAAAVQPPKRNNVRTRGANSDIFHHVSLALSNFSRRRQPVKASTFLCSPIYFSRILFVGSWTSTVFVFMLPLPTGLT